jgi:adenylate cyclase
MSEAKDQGYFSDGISQELLNLLTNIPQLKVAARISSFSFKGKQVEIPEIARQLHVAKLLERSVRKSGDRLRITAQLIPSAVNLLLQL